jgi:hypothetical protein
VVIVASRSTFLRYLETAAEGVVRGSVVHVVPEAGPALGEASGALRSA